MHTFLRTFFIGAVLAIGVAGVTVAADAPDPIVGTWSMVSAKSTFSPGPALKSQTRTYAQSPDGIAMSVKSVAADGTASSGQSTFKYDGKDYPISGSPDYDSLALKQVNPLTVTSEQKRAGKVVGTTTRTISADGKVMTLSSKGTGANGVAFNNVMVFTRN